MIVVDWGTTNLRAYLCEDDGTIIKRVTDERGIKKLERKEYPLVMGDILSALDAEDAQIFISGMAGSRGGWQEVPYCQAPVDLSMIAKALMPLPQAFNGYLVPGVRIVAEDGTSDVIRGEEVQVFGAINRLGLDDAILCLPGTHSKWVQVRERRIQCFMTFMTGDLFQSLGQTILSCKTDDRLDSQALLAGIDAVKATSGGLLHQLFTARTGMLDGTLAESSVSSFVSGLLLGHELHQAGQFMADQGKIIVIGSEQLVVRYQMVLEHLLNQVEVLGSDIATCGGIAALREHLVVN
ncbi:MAG: 2-dehydro-3-deoxygalactonokinase [Desulfuromonadales bacterium]|nr:2-dehydro-3-deoxygalactonokinase [Desulfuromonadales bacterium]